MRESEGSAAAARSDEKIPRVPPPFLSQASFLDSVRIGQVIALRQLFLFYSPILLEQARMLRVPGDERHALVVTVLDDLVMQLQDSRLVPRDLACYLVGSLRNSVRKSRRTAMRQENREQSAYTELPRTGERVVAECHSQYSLRVTGANEGSDVGEMGVALSALASAATAALNETETRLMVGLSRHIPLRDLADQSGITYGAARVRVHRLRERLVAVAFTLRQTLPPDGQRELDRFFRRAGVALARPAKDTRPSSPPADGPLTPKQATDDNT